MTLLQIKETERTIAREALRQNLRSRLRLALARFLPGSRVVVFGSLTKPGNFSEFSDIDLALEVEPVHISICQLTARLMEEMGRAVDVILLPDCRFRERILSEGEQWILPD